MTQVQPLAVPRGGEQLLLEPSARESADRRGSRQLPASRRTLPFANDLRVHGSSDHQCRANRHVADQGHHAARPDYGGRDPRVRCPLRELGASIVHLHARDDQGRAPSGGGLCCPPVAGAERVGELGALAREQGEHSIAAWIDDDGHFSTERHLPVAARPSVLRATRWTLAPMRWPATGTRVDRFRAVANRASRSLHPSPGTATPVKPPGEPSGYLHAEPAGTRLALWSSLHPVTGDQLLSTREREATDLGYAEPVLLGYIDRAAPVSGRLGTGSPHLPWASRFGRPAARS